MKQLNRKIILFLFAMIFCLYGCTEESSDSDTTDSLNTIDESDAEEDDFSFYTIVIDPGHQSHGNYDTEPVGPGATETKAKVSSGTQGCTTGVPEYQLNLDIALVLKEKLQNIGYNVIMTRETNDVDISNSQRAAIANDADADIFIRIHADGSENTSQRGCMTICQTSQNPYNGDLYSESYRLSESILEEYASATGFTANKIWETDTMSGINWSQVPCTILEMGYMTNPEEDELMEDPEMQQKMVQGIVNGIQKYLDEGP